VSSKIGGVDNSQTAAIGAGRAVQRPQDAAAGGAQSSSTSSGSEENVQITGAARQLASLEQAVRDAPAVNTARVEQISTALAQGTYTINSQHIADQLMQSDKELAHLGNQHQPETGRPETDSEADAAD
jgi:negative regulator of flagellin synthesis FlgM